MPDDVTCEVLAAEEQRCAAIAAGDWNGLDKIVADDFLYTHSVGKTDDKEAWLAWLKTRLRTVNHEGLLVRSFGNVALLSGRFVDRYAEPIVGDSHYGPLLDVLQVWVRHQNNWQIVAQHSVRISNKA